LIKSPNIKVQPLINKSTLLGVFWIQWIIHSILVSKIANDGTAGNLYYSINYKTRSVFPGTKPYYGIKMFSKYPSNHC
jgi:hypothetical protein